MATIPPARPALRRAILRLVLAFACLAIAAPRSIAELPVPLLNSVTPMGGKIGAETEVTITGADLDEVDALHFSHPGIAATLKTPNHFTVKIAPEVPVGNYDVRVVGKFGVSNPRAFVAGDRPEVTRTKAHDKPEAAVELPMGSVFNGNATAAISDYFKFAAKKGERVLIVCATKEIDSRMSPVLAALDAGGHEIESARKGGLLDFTAPSDGQFLVTLHDLTYAGGPDYFYRLTVSKGPCVDFVFPPAGLPGSKTAFTFYGRGLPGGKSADLRGGDRKPLERLDVEIALPAASDAARHAFTRPVSAVDEGIFYSLKSAEGSSSPVFIGFSSAPISKEAEPNNKAGQAQKITVPCEVAGQFFPAADVDCYAFDAKKGDVYWLEVFSHRTGRTTSPFLLVQREGTDIKEVYASDADPGGKRFTTLSNDPAFRFEAKEDGTYRVSVSDLFGATRSNPASTYRLAIRKETPDFRLVALVEPPPPATKKDDRSAAPRGALLRAGETTAVKVIAIRRDGFSLGDSRGHALHAVRQVRGAQFDRAGKSIPPNRDHLHRSRLARTEQRTAWRSAAVIFFRRRRRRFHERDEPEVRRLFPNREAIRARGIAARRAEKIAHRHAIHTVFLRLEAVGGIVAQRGEFFPAGISVGGIDFLDVRALALHEQERARRAARAMRINLQPVHVALLRIERVAVHIRRREKLAGDLARHGDFLRLPRLVVRLHLPAQRCG